MERITAAEKVTAVQRHLKDGESYKSIGKLLGVDESVIRDWCRIYESIGPEGFLRKARNEYSLEFKESAVKYYLEGKGSLRDTCKVFKIRDKGQLRDWIKRYNDHSLKSSSGGKVRMTVTKGRKTTLQERIDIVIEILRSGASYAEAAEKYNVSYGQVYQWVQKYSAKGVDGLIDRRGRSKPIEEMTEVEKLRAENKLLKAQLERKELENIFLKKVEEIERRRS